MDIPTRRDISPVPCVVEGGAIGGGLCTRRMCHQRLLRSRYGVRSCAPPRQARRCRAGGTLRSQPWTGHRSIGCRGQSTGYAATQPAARPCGLRHQRRSRVARSPRGGDVPSRLHPVLGRCSARRTVLQENEMPPRPLPPEKRWRRGRWRLRGDDVPQRFVLLQGQRLRPMHRPRPPHLLPFQHLRAGRGLLR